MTTLSVCIITLIPAFSVTIEAAGVSSLRTDLDPSLIPKFVNQLTGPPPVFIPTKIMDPVSGQMTDYYSIIETETSQQILPAYDIDGKPTGFASTQVWGYGGLAKDAVTNEALGWVRGTPSATIEATRGTPVNVAWVNGIITPLSFTVDPSLDATNSAGSSLNVSDGSGSSFSGTSLFPVTTTTHLQGGEVSSQYAGVPYSWVGWNGLHGSDYYTYSRTLPNAAVYHYDNLQAPGTMWFRDRAVGMTRSNVYSGLSGFYMLRDPADQIADLLPSGKYEMPISIQDRNFYTDGSLKLPSAPMDSSGTDPAWLAEYYGNVIMVNGKVWPNMNVDRGQYLLKILDGSDARWYDLSMSNGMSFRVIAADENYLSTPVTTSSLTIAPGERYDVLIDFGGYQEGTEIVLTNKASTPYVQPSSAVSPSPAGGGMSGSDNKGGDSGAASDSVIMKFTVGGRNGLISRTLPDEMNPSAKIAYDLSSASRNRTFTLFDYSGQIGNSVLLDGKQYKTSISEFPEMGTTEIWNIVDATNESHQIHLDLVNFQIISRQDVDVSRYRVDWLAANGGSLPITNDTINIELSKYLLGTSIGPTSLERGLRDSLSIHPGEAVSIIVRFAPADGRVAYAFDATQGPTYIWNSNIFDHEMNELMRQFVVT